MRFKDHPKLTCAGGPVWPPALAVTPGEEDTPCRVENAVLKNVRYFKVSTSEGPRLLLEFSCGERICGGTLKLDQSAYIMPLFEWLKKLRGKTVQEIGDSEIGF